VGYDEPIGERRYDVESVKDRALEPSRRYGK
jgi:[NiFe] hydrogenase diaphorase moiety small subunit